MKNIDSFDLNLLVAFDALMRTRNVTRAAQRVGLAQPSLSNALARLRTALDDPLFLRTPQGMQPTEKALRIAPQVAAALDAARAVLADTPEFDPASAEAEIRLALADYAGDVLLPPLIAALAERAPGVTLRVVPFDRTRVAGALDAGEIDLAIGVPGPVAAHHAARVLLAERHACLVSAVPGQAEAGLDLDAFLDRPQARALPDPGAPDPVDVALAEIGAARRVMLTVPSYLALPSLVAGSEMIAVLPRRLALRAATLLPVTLAEPPLALPGFRVTMVWTRAQASAPQLRWLRGLMGEVATALDMPEGLAEDDEDLMEA